MSKQRANYDTTIIWFRNDLRIHDNPALAASVGARRLLPIYIFPPRSSGTTRFGFRKTGPFRAKFLLETLAALKESLQKRGSDLVIFRGDPAAVLSFVAGRVRATAICYQEEPGTEEAAEVEAVRRTLDATTTLVAFHGSTLYHPDDLPFEPTAIPDVYTSFRKAVEKSSSVRSPLPTPDRLPTLPEAAGELSYPPAGVDLSQPHALSNASDRSELPTIKDLAGRSTPKTDERQVMSFRGGESAALDRLRYYLWDSDRIKRYRDTRNGLLGADYSTKLSPWLANGSLSPRTIYAEVKRYESERVKNDSTYWLVFELIWRDYFAFLAAKYRSAIFRIAGPKQRYFDWRDDWNAFDRWREGTTGQDFIDANMREIAATGYMSNRGRQNVASFLARDLGVNWLMGAEWFESLLIDYDPASNYGNWTYNVGVGTDPRLDRYFDPERQAQKYDPRGRYRSVWSS